MNFLSQLAARRAEYRHHDSPLLLMTAAFSSFQMEPSGRRVSLRVRTITALTTALLDVAAGDGVAAFSLHGSDNGVADAAWLARATENTRMVRISRACIYRRPSVTRLPAESFSGRLLSSCRILFEIVR